VRARTARKLAAIPLSVGALAGGAESAVALRNATSAERRGRYRRLSDHAWDVAP
jgi:hypothetical protein